MAPTYGNEEIEGRSYKEYDYSPVPASSLTSYSARTNSVTIVPSTPEDRNEAAGRPTSSRINDHNHFRPSTMSEKGSTSFQLLAAVVSNLSVMATGAMLGWTSPMTDRLETSNPDNPLHTPLKKDESTWVGSLVALGAIGGSFTSGYLAERIGRKKTLLSSVVPYTIGWILIASAQHLEQLYAARLIFGFALGFAFTVVPMYCGEIAEVSIRGTVGSFLQLFITIGLLYSFCIGPYVSYLVFAILCGCLPIVFFIFFAMMPESPYYLLGKGDREAAIDSLVRLRRKPASAVKEEADEMQAQIDEAFRSEAKVMDLFTQKANFMALLCTCALAGFQQLTGINVVLFYMQDIFSAAKTTMAPALCTIIVGIVQVATSGITPLVVDRLGRKLLLIFSGVGEIISLATLGLYFYLQDTDEESVESIRILPVIALIIFISTYSVGWGPLPWAVMGEMFASDVKSKASGITVSMCWGLAFILTKFGNVISKYVAFWGFTAFCVLSVLFTIFILPETKGKNLRQIQDELCGIKPSAPRDSLNGVKN